MNTHRTTRDLQKAADRKGQTWLSSCQCHRQFGNGEINMGGRNETGFLKELVLGMPLLAVRPTIEIIIYGTLSLFQAL